MSRRKNDFYPTPVWATEELLKKVRISGVIMEPCSGKLDMANTLKAHPNVSKLITNDIDNKMKADTHFDASDPNAWGDDQFTWVISNPPFSKAMKIVELAHKHSVRGVAMLLRLSFIEPTFDRGSWLAKHPPNKLIVLPRISFTGDGKTDTVTCAWFVWDCFKYDKVIEVISKGPKINKPKKKAKKITKKK